MAQRLPNECEETPFTFQKFATRFRKQHYYTLSQTANATQIPIYFEMPLDIAIIKKGEEIVTIRMGGNKKQ
jgi:hypothetical protein